MKTSRWNRVAVVTAAGLLALTTAACSGDDEVAEADTSTSEATSSPMTDTVAAPFGPGCAAVPADGAGSFEGMSTAPVATAASNNPVLSTLVTAVQAAGLVDTLNSASGITVFAPSNDAFAKVPQDQLQALLADKDALTRVLTYHVVGERIAPEELGSSGPYQTLAEAPVEASGSAPDLTVGDGAEVVCGGITTANANVYIIDSVLMPPAA